MGRNVANHATGAPADLDLDDLQIPSIHGTRAFGVTLWHPSTFSLPGLKEHDPGDLRIPSVYRVRGFGMWLGKPYTAYEPRPLPWERALTRVRRFFGFSA